MATFTINLNAGDVETPYNLLTYKIYGLLDNYATPIDTFGTADADADVTVAGAIATITNVAVGSNTTFKVIVTDADGHDSLISDAYVYTPPAQTELYTLANAANILNEVSNATTGILESTAAATTLSVNSSDKPSVGSNAASIKLNVDTAGTSTVRAYWNQTTVSGKTYRFNFWAKGGTNSPYFDLPGNQGWTDWHNTPITGTWAEYTVDAVASGITGRVDFAACSGGIREIGDFIMFDLVSIIQLD